MFQDRKRIAQDIIKELNIDKPITDCGYVENSGISWYVFIIGNKNRIVVRIYPEYIWVCPVIWKNNDLDCNFPIVKYTTIEEFMDNIRELINAV